MTNKKSDHAKNHALDLFTRLQLSLQQHATPERYQYVLNILETGLSKVEHNQQTPERQARVVYDQIASQVFVDKLQFTVDENKVLTAIDELAHSQKGWGEFNMLGTTNTWPSQ
ncbi:PbsX family transcriptional regulator [Lactiplantibacillus pentosus]|nr:PbsX family transcriptional regulator [Lactiplantibacillus pentosus]MDO7803975.1 PbsX family transcriptional regulator [Lactiplantibacillus pentosus]